MLGTKILHANNFRELLGLDNKVRAVSKHGKSVIRLKRFSLSQIHGKSCNQRA